MLKSIAAGIKRFIASYLLALLLGLAALAALAITTRMNQMSGVASAASAEGQFLIGWAAIVVHVAGVVLCGIVAGAAGKRGYRKLAIGMGVIVIASAIVSAMMIMGFMASEVLSISKAREEQIAARKEDREARRTAADKRLDIQAKLAEKQMGWNKETEIKTSNKDVGRRERKETRKDMQDASRAIIAEIGKDSAAPAETAPPPPLVIPDAGSELISSATFGLVTIKGAQTLKLAYLTILLLVLEVVLWPTAGYAWGGFASGSIPRVVDPAPTVPLTPEPAKLDVNPPLALPKPAAQSVLIRAEPAPEWRAMLDLIDFPRKKTLGARRPRDKREVLGLRFLTWLCAHGHVGEFTADQIDKLYEDFAAIENKEEWASRIVKAELRDAKKWVQVKDSRSPTLWIITSPPIARLKDLLAKRKIAITPMETTATPPKQEVGNVLNLPFGDGASEVALPAPEAPIRKPIAGLAELQQRLPPDLRSMGRLERVNKRMWQARIIVPNRKSLNRMSRARAA